MDAHLILVAHDSRYPALRIFSIALCGLVFGNDKDLAIRREFNGGTKTCHTASDNEEINDLLPHTARIQDGVEESKAVSRPLCC